jgi:hypothetical protein
MFDLELKSTDMMEELFNQVKDKLLPIDLGFTLMKDGIIDLDVPHKTLVEIGLKDGDKCTLTCYD